MTADQGDSPRYATLSDYLRVVRENLVVILLLALLFGGAALAWSLRQDPEYVSEAALSFQDPGRDLDILGTPVSPSESPEQRAAEASTQILQIENLEIVRERLRTSLSAAELRGMLSAEPEARTNFVVVQARADDARFAATLAEEVATVGRTESIKRARERLDRAAKTQRRRLRSLDRRTDAVTRSVIADRVSRLETLRDIARPVEVVRHAGVPASPVAPRPVRNTILGVILGLTLGLIAAFVRDALDQRLRRASDVESEFDLPVLGHLSDDALGRSVVAGTGQKPFDTRELETARMVRIGLDYLNKSEPFTSVAVTSALPEEGKTTVAAVLTYASSLAGKRSVLVECDLRRPVLARRLGLESQPGLSDVLLSRVSIGEAVQHLAPTTGTLAGRNGSSPAVLDPDRGAFDCIVAGTHTTQPAELLGSPEFGAFVEELGRTYDVVVLDTAPLLAVVDTRELMRNADRMVLCVRRGKTKRDQAVAARAVLSRMPDRPAGLVVTGVRARDAAYYGGYAYDY